MSSYCMSIYFVLFCLMLSLQHTSQAVYSFQCPTQSHWRHRERTYCNSSSSYFCLYDLNENNFTEMCREESEIEKAGYKQIVSGSKHGTLQGDTCEKDFFQPFKFNSSGNSRCIYQKFHCSEEGQVIYSNGTIEANRECRCDYTRGYDFLHRPKNQCFCVPSEEDCSCYLNMCSVDCSLSPDYECLRKTEWKLKFNCELINIMDSMEETMTVKSTDGDINQEQTIDRYSLPALVVILACIAIVCVFVIGLLSNTRPVHDEICAHSVSGDLKTAINSCNKNKTSSIIPHDVLELQEKEIVKWRKSNLQFVETTASKTVLDKIDTHGFIILLGPPGSGKSAIAYNTAFMLEKNEGYDILPITSPDEIRKYLLTAKKQIFIIDDPIGKYTVDDSCIQKWKNEDTFINQTFTCSFTTKLILTCRSYIYKNGFCHKLNVSPVQFDLLSCNLKLSSDERIKLCHRYQIPDLNENTTNMYDFFPLLCTLYSTNEDATLFFVNPCNILWEEMRNTKEKSDIAFLALALLVVQDNKVDSQLLSFTNNTIKELLNDLCNECGFKYFPSTAVIQEALYHLIGTYVKENDNVFTCIHDTLFQNLLFIVGGCLINCILKYGSSKFLANRLQLASIQQEHDELVIILKPEQEELFFERLLLDIRKGNHSNVFTGIQMKCLLFRTKLIEYLRFLKAEDLKCNEYNSTPLHIATEQGYAELTHFLVKVKKDQTNHQDRNKRTPLYLACLGGHDNVVKVIHLHDQSTLEITNIDDCTPLDAASSNGHSSTVKLLLEFGANSKKKDSKMKRTALYRACENGHYDVVQLLLSKNPDVRYTDAKGLKAIHIVCSTEHAGIVELLLSYKDMINECDSYGRTPLFIACESNQQIIVDKLLEYKANVNQTNKQNITPLHKACENRNEKIVGRLLNNNAKVNVQCIEGLSPLYIACFNGQHRIVDILLDKKADVNIANKQGCTPFFISCSEDHLEICKVLQQKGANINTADTFAFTPLHVACREKRYRIVRFLLDYNANVNAVNRQKESSLYISCMNESLEIIELLLGNNADVKLCDEQGNSPLHVACLKGNRKIVQLLLDKKSDKYKINNAGKTPVDVVQGIERDKILEMLNNEKS